MGKKDQGIKGGEQRYHTIPRVLVFLRNDSDVLLLKGAPNKRIWANQYNGVGGHVERGEDILSAANREVFEETGINPDALELRAVVNINAGDPSLGIVMFVFFGWSSKRAFINSDEGELHWVPIEDLEKYHLVEDLRWLLPQLLEKELPGTLLYLHYHYDNDDRLVIFENR